MTLKRPTINGKELSTLQELATTTGLSLNHLRERTRHHENRRGALIPSHKIGRQIWVDMGEAIKVIYADRNQPASINHPTASATPDDLAWL